MTLRTSLICTSMYKLAWFGKEKSWYTAVFGLKYLRARCSMYTLGIRCLKLRTLTLESCSSQGANLILPDWQAASLMRWDTSDSPETGCSAQLAVCLAVSSRLATCLVTCLFSNSWRLKGLNSPNGGESGGWSPVHRDGERNHWSMIELSIYFSFSLPFLSFPVSDKNQVFSSMEYDIPM